MSAFFVDLSAYHLDGVITVLLLFVFSHAPHQENDEFAIILWSHSDMRRKSS